MDMNSKPTIWIGDTYDVEFEVRQPDYTGQSIGNGLPANPTQALVRVANSDGLFLPLGGAGIFIVNAAIVPATGIEPQATGAIISYRLISNFTTVADSYSMYITLVFADGKRQTTNYRFTINDFT